MATTNTITATSNNSTPTMKSTPPTTTTTTNNLYLSSAFNKTQSSGTEQSEVLKKTLKVHNWIKDKIKYTTTDSLK